MPVAAISRLFFIMLFSFQDNLIFYPIDPNNPRYDHYRASEISLESHGHTLQGWHFENENAGNQKVLLYLGGNAEDVTFNFEELNRFGAREFYFLNYRGYGKSGGKPSQQALYEDGLAIHDALVNRGVDPGNLIILGRSLGAAVATYITANRPVGRVILVTPFDSLENLASRMFPLLPVKWILNHPFPSIQFAPGIDTPLLMLVAAKDEVIPTSHSEKLFQAWGGEKHWQLLQGVGHNNIQVHPEYYPAIHQFVSDP